MLSQTEIRKGKIISFEGEPYQVMTSDYLRKQQRRPVMRTVLRHLKTGATKEHSFQQSDKVEEADIERKPYQFLFSDGTTYAFMDQDTYEQVELTADMVGDVAKFLLDGQEVLNNSLEGQTGTIDFTPPEELTYDEHMYELTVWDINDNSAIATRVFQILPSYLVCEAKLIGCKSLR